MEVFDDYGIEIPDTNLDKVMAGISIITSDDFYKRLPVFIQLCNVLADDEFDPSSFDPADPEEIAWGITEALLLSPPEEGDDEPFSDEIRYYIGHIMSENGIVDPPDVLRIAMQDVPMEDPLAISADDPEMYSAFFHKQQDESKLIKQLLQIQIKELLQQLEGLTLKHGSTDEIRKGLVNIFKKTSSETPRANAAQLPGKTEFL